MNILIIYNRTKDVNREKLKILIGLLKQEKINYVINSNYENMDEQINLYCKDSASYDLIISLGGDGTVMHGCQYALKYSAPIVGINIGKLGFLTQIDINDIYILKNFFSKKYKIDERVVLEVNINNNTYYAINDLVVARGKFVKLINLNLYCNNQKVCKYRADGMIIATPTGSTAYSLAAGGPIVDATIKGMIVTPISSHSLKDRSIIFDKDKKLSVESLSDDSLMISCDGNIVDEIQRNDKVYVKISNKICKFINFDTRYYLKIFDNPI